LIISAVSIFAVIVTLAGFRIYRLAVMWSHRRTVVYPLWHMLTELTGYAIPKPGRFQSVPSALAGGPNYTVRDRPEKFLTIPRDYASDDNALVKFELPFTWQADAQAQTRITQVIGRHLGGDWAPTWSLNTSPRFVALCHEPKPPQSVTLAEFAPHFDKLADSALGLGIGANNHVISINLDSDAPHIAIPSH